MSDIDAQVDGWRLVLLVHSLLLSSCRPSIPGITNTSPWYDIVKNRVQRLWAGDFEGLYREAAGSSSRQAHLSSHLDVDPKTQMKRTAARAVDVGLQGNLSKSLRTLTGKQQLPLAEDEVRRKFEELINPRHEDKPQAWQPFVRTVAGLPPPSDPSYSFVLGSSMVPGANGEMREVDTLAHVLQHLDSTSAAGVSGLGYDLLRNISPEIVRPLLAPYFGQGRWDYSRSVLSQAGEGELRHYHADTHAMMISVCGFALNKKDEAYVAGHPFDLRPICIGESLRRIAARCQLLQSEHNVGIKLAANGQLGCGFSRGTGTVYHMISKALDALSANEVPCGLMDNDAKNAYCSVLRAAMQRGIAKHAPELLPAFDFLYANTAFCFFYAPGASAPVASCEIFDGVQQGEVFGPLFFSLALDELLCLLRARMLDLPVDSTMVNQNVEIASDGVVGAIVGYNPATLGVARGSVMRLVEAPSYTFLDAASSEERSSLYVSVAVIPPPAEDGYVPAEVVLTVPWSTVRLRAHCLVVAYLDDIKFVGELHLLRPFALLLRELGPGIGLVFEKLSKNYAYVPRIFRDALGAMYPDAVVVDSATAGDSPSGKLKTGADELARDGAHSHRRLLVTLNGIADLMGAPMRVLFDDDRAAEDRDWMRAQIHVKADETKCLFAHMGIAAVDAVAESQRVVGYQPSDTVPCLPEEEAQLQFILTRYCLSTRLKHVAQFCPTSLVERDFEDVDTIAAAAVAGAMGLSLASLTVGKVQRLLLPMRHSGLLPGSKLPAKADLVSLSAQVERQVLFFGDEAAREWRLPFALQALCERLRGRGVAGASTSFTPLELDLQASCGSIEAAFCAYRLSGGRRGNSRGGNSPLGSDAASAVPLAESHGAVAVIGGPAAASSPPVPLAPDVSFEHLSDCRHRSPAMSEVVWRREFLGIYNGAPLLERAAMDSGCTKGAALFCQSIPMAKPFTFSSPDFRRQCRRYLGIAPMAVPHNHLCGQRGWVRLDADNARHIWSCPCAGRSFAPHNHVRDVMAHAVQQCGLTSGVARTEVPLSVGSGSSNNWNADLVFYAQASGVEYIFDFAILNVDAASYSARCRSLGDAQRLLVAEENSRRQNRVVQGLLNERGSTRIFVPFVMLSNGGFGPAARDFLTTLYRTARAEDRFYLGVNHPVLDTSWNTLTAPTYWDMRLSVACTLADAQFQGRIIGNDLSLALPGRGRQPHPNPNHAPFAPRRPVPVRQI